mmetsp:Transcript_26599/g.35537  ORF Transcript_26599/g.35537 Transcript_26599/m.35537 type:complete len:102 (+) Transcript_26599:1018-1323(+)
MYSQLASMSTEYSRKKSCDRSSSNKLSSPSFMLLMDTAPSRKLSSNSCTLVTPFLSLLSEATNGARPLAIIDRDALDTPRNPSTPFKPSIATLAAPTTLML